MEVTSKFKVNRGRQNQSGWNGPRDLSGSDYHNELPVSGDEELNDGWSNRLKSESESSKFCSEDGIVPGLAIPRRAGHPCAWTREKVRAPSSRDSAILHGNEVPQNESNDSLG